MLSLCLVFCAPVRNRKQDTSFNQQVTMDTQIKGPLSIALLGLEQIHRATLLIHIDAYLLIMYTSNIYGKGEDSAQNSSLRLRLLRDRA